MTRSELHAYLNVREWRLEHRPAGSLIVEQQFAARMRAAGEGLAGLDFLVELAAMACTEDRACHSVTMG